MPLDLGDSCGHSLYWFDSSRWYKGRADWTDLTEGPDGGVWGHEDGTFKNTLRCASTGHLLTFYDDAMK